VDMIRELEKILRISASVLVNNYQLVKKQQNATIAIGNSSSSGLKHNNSG